MTVMNHHSQSYHLAMVFDLRSGGPDDWVAMMDGYGGGPTVWHDLSAFTPPLYPPIVATHFELWVAMMGGYNGWVGGGTIPEG